MKPGSVSSARLEQPGAGVVDDVGRRREAVRVEHQARPDDHELGLLGREELCDAVEIDVEPREVGWLLSSG